MNRREFICISAGLAGSALLASALYTSTLFNIAEDIENTESSEETEESSSEDSGCS